MIRFAPFKLKDWMDFCGLPFEWKYGGQDSSISIHSIGEPIDRENEGLSFLINESFLPTATPYQSKANVLIVQQQLWGKLEPLLENATSLQLDAPPHIAVTPKCYEAFALCTQWIALNNPGMGDWERGMEDQPAIHHSAEVHSSVRLGPGVVIEKDVIIEEGVVLMPNVVIGHGTRIGKKSILFPGVVVYPHSIIGERVRLHANVVIGSDGFGYAPGSKGAVKIMHFGSVVIGNDVEIGAGTTIDRGTLKNTVIEAGTKIDNQVQVGHNVYVKSHAILCAQAGLAGNATVGHGAILAGKAGLADKVEVGDQAVVGPMTGVSKDIPAGMQVMGGFPAKPRREWWKFLAHMERLPDLIDRMKKLESEETQKEKQ